MPTDDSAVSSHKRTTRIYYIERLGSTLNLKGGTLPRPTMDAFALPGRLVGLQRYLERYLLS